MTITVLWFPWGREIWLIHSLLHYGITLLGGIYSYNMCRTTIVITINGIVLRGRGYVSNTAAPVTCPSLHVADPLLPDMSEALQISEF